MRQEPLQHTYALKLLEKHARLLLRQKIRPQIHKRTPAAIYRLKGREGASLSLRKTPVTMFLTCKQQCSSQVKSTIKNTRFWWFQIVHVPTMISESSLFLYEPSILDSALTHHSSKEDSSCCGERVCFCSKINQTSHANTHYTNIWLIISSSRSQWG